MLILLIGHMAAALLAPTLIARLGRRAFLILAVAPASAAIWALAHTDAVVRGDGPASHTTWVDALGLHLSFRLDVLSWLMVLLVGGIGSLILVYCSRYFSPRSTGLGRFAAVLTAFAGSMFGLVISSNLIQIFVFWELTTVFSFLLIGHYSDRPSSRRAAMKAIIVTAFGGLAMLVGIIILGTGAGSYEVAEVIAATSAGTLTTIAVLLLLVGVATKSALIPFHFWLPAAMAAPTPVSAYLHAAAMVKAGIYLVARFAPGYAGIPAWEVAIVALGTVTLLVGGYRALRQHDLKLILAFGTVSQLGMLVLLLGTGSKAVALAGLAMLGAHAMFKASLFLTVGVIDAATGTRDIRQLSGVGKALPGLAMTGWLATASMIGLPPLAGYVAKEAALEGLLGDASAGPLGWVTVAAIAVGSVFTVAYGLRAMWGAFATKPQPQPLDGEPITISKPPFLLVAPAALLALAGLGTALLPHLGEQLLRPYADQYPDGPVGHLTLWAGFTPTLAITVAVLALGVLLFMARDRIERAQAAVAVPIDADRVYRGMLRRVDNLAADVTALFQRGSLPFYLGVILVVVVVVPGGAMLLFTRLPELTWFDSPAKLLVAGLTIASAIIAIRSRRRLKAVVLAGATGYGTAMLFLLHGATDLALTQVLVEAVTVVTFVLVLRRLPTYFSNRPLVATRWLRLGVGISVGITIGALALVIPQARIHEPVSTLLPAEAVDFGGGHNIVNVILVDTRAWDTMGEIAVLVTAATGVASLIFLRGRGSRLGHTVDDLDDSGTTEAWDPDPLEPLRRQRVGEQASVSRSRQWLWAGSTMAPQRRSVILEVATRVLFHTMVVVALYLLFSGHNGPGGGFAAGLVVGVALTLRYLAGGRYELGAATPLQPGVLLGSGLVFAAGTGLVAMILGGEVLQSAILTWDVPVIGQIKLVTSLFFDIGVFLVVIGLMTDILRSLGAEIDRHGERSGHDSDLSISVVEPPAPIRRPPL